MKKEIYYINHNYLFIINVKLSQPRTHKQWLPSFIYIWTYSLLCKNYRKMDLKQGSQPAGSNLWGGSNGPVTGLACQTPTRRSDIYITILRCSKNRVIKS